MFKNRESERTRNVIKEGKDKSVKTNKVKKM
jgi:hypothetical protein